MNAPAGRALELRSVLVGEVKTAEHALNGLLRAGLAPSAIITTPIEEVRRSSGMEADYYCDLVQLAEAHGIRAHVTDDLTSRAAALEQLRPDCIWIMGWPYLVRAPVLALGPCIGMHPTPLPRRRGGAPMNWTLLDDERSSAVTLFGMRAGLDDGDILAQEEFEVGPEDYVGDVASKVYDLTEKLVERAAIAVAEGKAAWRRQDGSQATYTRRRTPADGRIDWSDSSVRIRNLIRATSHPFPGAFTTLDGTTLRVWRAEVPLGYRAPLRAAPGTVVELLDNGLLVSTGDNALHITEMQLDGDDVVRSSVLAQRFRRYVGRSFS